MADQSVRITNLDSGSPTRVAYDLYQSLKMAMPASEGGYKEHVKRHLALYEECLHATTHRAVDVSKLT